MRQYLKHKTSSLLLLLKTSHTHTTDTSPEVEQCGLSLVLFTIKKCDLSLALYSAEPRDLRLVFTLQALYVMLALLFVWSATLLAAECLSFLVEMFIYTLIGLIINYQALAGYLPFVISVVVYSRGCYMDVYDVYIKYHRALFARLLEPVKTRVAICVCVWVVWE